MKKYFLILIGINILYANNTYYQHKVSQFKLFVQQKTHIIMLGDSITERGLWNELTLRDDIVNRGISGDTTDGVLKRLKYLNKNSKHIFIMIGINDILRDKSAEYVFYNYKKILLQLKSKKMIPLIQSTVYVGEKAPKYYNNEVKKLNLLLENYARMEHLEYIDLNVKLAPKGFLLKDYSLDGLHLNGKAYLLWTHILKKYFLSY